MTDEELEILISLEDKVITANDARLFFGGCVPIWKQFAEKHSLNFKDFIKNGLPASVFYQTNDYMAKELIKFIYLKDKV